MMTDDSVGTQVLEAAATAGMLDELMAALDADDVARVGRLLRKAGLHEAVIEDFLRLVRDDGGFD